MGNKATRYHTFSGKCKWAKLDTPDTKYVQEGKWTIVLYPNEAALMQIKEFKKQGLLNHIKMDDDGEYITFSRPVQKLFRGRLKAFLPPTILNKACPMEPGDGPPAGSFILPRNTKIGNGSDVTVSVEIYWTGQGEKERPNARLAAVRIDNLVTYTREDLAPKEQSGVRALDRTPAQLF